MICSNCNEDNPMGSTVCSRCGARLEARKCSRCGGEIRGKSRFCIHCGTSMSGDSPAPRPVSRKRHPSSSQQKQSQTPSYQTPRQSPPPQQGGFPPPQQGGYPPPQQGGYPPQQGGYPPQQGGYPPQQGNYPPQQGGYPPQQQGGYPPQQGGSQVSYSYPSPNDKDQQTLKSKTILLKEQFGAVIKKGNYREVLQDKKPSSHTGFHRLHRMGHYSFLWFCCACRCHYIPGNTARGMGCGFRPCPLPFVYASYKKEIDEKVRDMKGQMSSGPSPIIDIIVITAKLSICHGKHERFLLPDSQQLHRLRCMCSVLPCQRHIPDLRAVPHRSDTMQSVRQLRVSMSCQGHSEDPGLA